MNLTIVARTSRDRDIEMIMNYCSANVINFALIKSISKVPKAKFEHVPNVIQGEKLCPT